MCEGEDVTRFCAAMRCSACLLNGLLLTGLELANACALLLLKYEDIAVSRILNITIIYDI